MECDICKQSMTEEDACTFQGKQVCEDCFIEANSPVKSCGAGIGASEGASK